jgi:glutamate-ammonia-ligase adenylyltransferase
MPASEAMPLEEELERLGFADPPALAARIAGWRGGTVRCLRSDAALAALDAVQPALLAALAAAPEPDRAITRWERMITALPSAINLFRLLEARPGLLDILVRILSLAPPLADELARRADLLDR